VGDAESSRIKTDNPRQDDELFISPAARQELRIRIRRPVVLGEGSIDDDENKGRCRPRTSLVLRLIPGVLWKTL
jgi:hypothetical protein